MKAASGAVSFKRLTDRQIFPIFPLPFLTSPDQYALLCIPYTVIHDLVEYGCVVPGLIAAGLDQSCAKHDAEDQPAE
jgi:hypothetical protein